MLLYNNPGRTDMWGPYCTPLNRLNLHQLMTTDTAGAKTSILDEGDLVATSAVGAASIIILINYHDKGARPGDATSPKV